MLKIYRHKSLAVFLFVLLVLVFYLQSVNNVRHHLDNRPSTERAEAFILSPAFLEIAAGEFKGLMADYLLLKGVTFLGGRYETTESDLETIHTLFKQSLTLDPYFLQTCYLTQAYLAWGNKKVEAAIDLLKISNEHRYWDWNPSFFIGFDYYYFLNDNLTASTYLMEASKNPGAGPLPGFLAARLSQEGGETETAILFMESMYDTIEDESGLKQIDMRITALKGVLVIEKAISAFEANYNREPDNLQELVSSGILQKLPENPYKKPYALEDGVIIF